MKHCTTVLLLDNHVIDYNQRLCVDVQGVQTLNEHHVTNTRGAVTGDAVHLGTKILLNLILDVDRIGIGEILSAIVIENIDFLIVFSRECYGIQLGISLLFASLKSHSYGIEVWHGNIYRRSKRWHIQLEGTVLFSERTIAINVVGTDNATCNGITRSSIDDATTYHSGWILLLLGFQSASQGL